MAVSELPGNPNAVWTVKTNAAGLLVTLHHLPFALTITLLPHTPLPVYDIEVLV